MQLHDLVEQVSSFDRAATKDQIKLFAWWLHIHDGRVLFSPADIRGCYDKLHIKEPPALATYLTRMFQAKDLLKEKGGYKLARGVRAEFDKKYGTSQSVVVVSKLLADLVNKVSNFAEQSFLDEAVKCYRVGAYRACVIMVWNVTYNHLLNWILCDSSRLSTFNAAIVKRNSKKAGLIVKDYDGFGDLKEREVVDICSSSNIYSTNIYKILVSKLDRRNIAAHPSAVMMVQSQADDMITDLVNNVILALR